MPEIVTYQADGLAMTGQLFRPSAIASAPGPGVLVFSDAFGVGEHALSAARRLAELGYVALACDLHGEGRIVGDFDEAMGVIAMLADNLPRLRARARGGFDAMMASPGVDPARVAAIGYCFGGAMALELARSGADVKGVVGFHSSLTTGAPQDAHQIKGRVLVCIGADDPVVPAEHRTAFEAEMRAAGVDWRMSLYGGVVHSFTDPGVDRLGAPAMARYDAAADRLSWAEMRGFLDDVIGDVRVTP